ncbi:MAG: hypothetical protein D6675_15640 [Gemmatimonadetes bacterium]|nr:MAG: hypothetical protein D6675_15640 [Gemmatimonadota bacterium]
MLASLSVRCENTLAYTRQLEIQCQYNTPVPKPQEKITTKRQRSAIPADFPTKPDHEQQI